MGKLTGEKKKKPRKKNPKTSTNLKYVIISRPTLPVAALMELIVLKNNKTVGKVCLCGDGGRCVGSRSRSRNPTGSPKSAAEVGDTEAVSKRGRIVFIWAEIKMEQLPWGRL